MSISYTPTTDDYIRAAKFHFKQSLKNKYLWLGVALAGIILLLLPDCGYILLRSVLMGGLSGIGIMMITVYLILPFSVKRQLKQNPNTFLTEVQVVLQEDGISLNSEFGTSHLKWANLYRWRKNDEYILLYSTFKFYHFVPMNLAEQGLDIDKMLMQLHEQVGKPA